MYPILLCSVVALAIIIERWIFLRRVRGANERFHLEVRTHLHPGSLDDAIRVCRASQAPLAQVFFAGLMRVADGEDRTRQAIEEVGQMEVAEFQRFMGGLSSIIGGATLLGFLGTVTGLIKAFQQVERLQGAVNPSVLASGIWEALLTTAFGLIVAIPASFAHGLIMSRIQGEVRQMEERSRKLMVLLVTGREDGA
jgi:biopolymer transport protein ExbB